MNKKEEFYKKEANMNKKEANKKENYKPIRVRISLAPKPHTHEARNSTMVRTTGHCSMDIELRQPVFLLLLLLLVWELGSLSVDYVLALLLPLLCCFRLGTWGGRYWSWYFSIGVGVHALGMGAFGDGALAVGTVDNSKEVFTRLFLRLVRSKSSCALFVLLYVQNQSRRTRFVKLTYVQCL